MAGFSETTRVGFGARIRNAIKGIGLGVFMVGGATYGIFWNEERAVETARALAEGAGLVVEVSAVAPQPSNEGALVHFNGPLKLPFSLRDEVLGVSAAPQTVRLERVVEQFAWVQSSRTSKENNIGGSQDQTTTYTYSKEWTDSPKSGGDFKVPEGHQNPPMPIQSQIFGHESGFVGGFEVTNKIEGLGQSVSVPLTADQTAQIEASLGLSQPATLSAGSVYFASDVQSPNVGDLRISYLVSDIAEVSAVGIQKGAQLLPYTAENGREVFLVDDGLHNAAEMFDLAQQTNATITWLWRFGLLVIMFFGFKAILGILDVLASFLPFLGWITSSVTSLISLGLTAFVGLGATALAWFYFRPVLSAIILGIALIGAAIFTYFARKKAKRDPVANAV